MNNALLTLSCKLVHFISHAWIVEVVIQQKDKWSLVSLRVIHSFRLQQSSNAPFPRSPVDLTAVRQLGLNFRFPQELFNAVQNCLSVQFPFSVLEREKKHMIMAQNYGVCLNGAHRTETQMRKVNIISLCSINCQKIQKKNSFSSSQNKRHI